MTAQAIDTQFVAENDEIIFDDARYKLRLRETGLSELTPTEPRQMSGKTSEISPSYTLSD